MKSRRIECSWVATQSALPRCHNHVISRDRCNARDGPGRVADRRQAGRCIAFIPSRLFVPSSFSSLALSSFLSLLTPSYSQARTYTPLSTRQHSFCGQQRHSYRTHHRSEPHHGTAHDRPMPGESAIQRSSVTPVSRRDACDISTL